MLPSQEQASSARRVGLRVTEAWAILPRCPWSSSGPVPVVDTAATLVQMSDSNPHVNRHDGCFPTNHEPRTTNHEPLVVLPSCPVHSVRALGAAKRKVNFSYLIPLAVLSEWWEFGLFRMCELKYWQETGGLDHGQEHDGFHSHNYCQMRAPVA
ncbi:uncharacterized protein PV07_11071 [Cladophialophora immunda]|uniref:Uncharacterized protein n=1 Tax=Cladophialophora immunda TaxID=569365 RepID=A0A0D2BWR6_9EURO|nr:uncharacterized protein PV07_11071 [Cladophialophora immunda]KIW22810.1 hypothetical protein PV07_11071 [Cladophialophora immunda]